ncbi:glycosyl transferase group 1 [Nakamurella multipartita DSM 44233]|uniref:Glycosyl transferase group 1 n=1 Tax=Nakamurella multipartita (strain ATCC 700099 / DSM 44233 / CIP 104796 / JCM 9543 / NBRC 105858 / Y-104) TaxID=479431 RepID=C8XEH6_NAKMY|nr:glycosyl transferase group 1 [Nakamurella multipartita DSM 44233]
MRVAHISDCFVPRLGGIEIQVNDLTRRQQAQGLTPEVITATPLPRRMAGRTFPVPIHRFGIPLPAEIANNPIPSRPIRKALRAGDYDLVHVHAGVGSPFAAAGVRVALELGFPVAVTVHCLPARFRLPDSLTPWATPEIARRIALSAVSQAAAAPLRARTGGPVTVVPNGLDPQDWAIEPVERDPAVVEVVSTMRLSVRKRPLPMLAMVRAAQTRLTQQQSPVTLRLTVFGDGKLMPRMRRYVHRHQMTDTVRLAGRVDRAELTEIYRRADVFLAPAHLESFGIAALEARCAGLPVVAMRATGITEFVADRQEGLLADDDAQMSDALVELAADAGLRASIAEHNRTTAPPTAWSTVLATVEREYQRAMAIRGATA